MDEKIVSVSGLAPLRMEFVLQPEDLREALNCKAPGQRATFRRGLIGWLVFVAIATLLFVWMKQTNAPAPPPAPAAFRPNPPARFETLQNILLPLVPWLLIFAFIWIFVFRQLRGRFRKAWENSAELQQTQTLEVVDGGIRINNVFVESFYRWIAFTGWAETKNLLMLFLSGGSRLPVPRRGATSDADWERFREAVRANVLGSKGGFQVVVPKPVLPLDQPAR